MNGVMSRLRPEDNARSRHPAAAGPAPDLVALLPIGADLLPRQANGGRRGRGTRLVAAGLVLVAVLAVAGAYLFSLHARSSADASLAAAQDQQHSLQVQQRTFADLVATRAQATRLRDDLASLMATDAPWSTLLAEIGKVRGGVSFTAVQAGVDDPAAPATPTTTGPVSAGGIGSVSISGTAPDKPTIATFVDALTGLTGLADPFLSDVSAVADGTSGGYSFTVSVALTGDLRSAATSRWATTTSTTTGGGK